MRKINIYWRKQDLISKLCRRLKKWCNIIPDWSGNFRRNNVIIGYKVYDTNNNWIAIFNI